jgi:hypothetical protein
MSRWRIAIVLFLLAAPLLAMAGIGSFYLWQQRLWLWVWWPMAACMVLGYVLAWHWQRKKLLIRAVDFSPSLEWTDRDLRAWELVKARAEGVARESPDRLTSTEYFLQTAQEMALEMARFYHPRATDPVGGVTIPEILAVIELVTRDLAEMAHKYVPGSHVLTVNAWRRAKLLSDWYPAASNTYWLISALFSPLQTGMRYLTTQAGMTRPFQLLKQNLVVWFATAFIHRVGAYLIDLYSGRLRVGAPRYRELQKEWAKSHPETLSSSEVRADGSVRIAVVGQVKAGKSSVINGLLGEQRAQTDVLPATLGVSRYQLNAPGTDVVLSLFDTVGYGHDGPKPDQLQLTHQMVQQADLVLFVFHALNPGREADLALAKSIASWLNKNPARKAPPILGVLTHIDLLAPAMEWSPPYDWVAGNGVKERNIRDAREYLRQQLETHLIGIVPVCAAEGRVYGFDEWLIPTLVELLDEARAAGLIRCLHAESNLAKVRKIVEQLKNAGWALAEALATRHLP